MSHFSRQLPFPAAWQATHAYALGATVRPTVDNGFFYRNTTAGTNNSSGLEPTWPTVKGATVVDGPITWSCSGTVLGAVMPFWDAEIAASINGDTGGCWTPSSIITFDVTNNNVVSVTGPTLVSLGGTLKTLSGALVKIKQGDYPRNGAGHAGRTRPILTSCTLAQSDTPYGIVADLALCAIDSTACVFTLLTASADDKTVSATFAPVQWVLPLDVHDTGTLSQVVLTYRSKLGAPKARVYAVDASNTLVPLTSASLGADASGFVDAPTADASLTVQSWTIPVDGGASSANAVVNRGASAYFLHIVEDQTQTTFPGAVRILSPVALATTDAIDLANAPSTIDSVTPNIGDRILVKDQASDAENGIYLYPGAGKVFAFTSGNPVPQWQESTSYAQGKIVMPTAGPNGFYYKDSTAGTNSSSGLEPLWPLTAGDTVVDGGVTWTAIAFGLQTFYKPVVELRRYGLAEGTIVPVTGGNQNAGTFWQYLGDTITASKLNGPSTHGPSSVAGAASQKIVRPSIAWTLASFAPAGNVYHAAAVDHVNILTQAFS